MQNSILWAVPSFIEKRHPAFSKVTFSTSLCENEAVEFWASRYRFGGRLLKKLWIVCVRQNHFFLLPVLFTTVWPVGPRKLQFDCSLPSLSDYEVVRGEVLEDEKTVYQLQNRNWHRLFSHLKIRKLYLFFSGVSLSYIHDCKFNNVIWFEVCSWENSLNRFKGYWSTQVNLHVKSNSQLATPAYMILYTSVGVSY